MSKNVLSNTIFRQDDFGVLRDIRFWLLLIVINCGPNLGFNHYFEQQTVKMLLFVICVFLALRKYAGTISRQHVSYIVFFGGILLIQAAYLDIYSITTSIHYVLMISIAVMIVAICGKDFANYYTSIIFIYACISLICFILQTLGVSIPYVGISTDAIEGGADVRVYSPVYTYLASGIPRNCGPFWEPGAYQGFLNLSLYFELTMLQVRDKYWKIRVIVLIAAVLTTLSTGGYITLFLILGLFFTSGSGMATWKKVSLLVVLLVVSIYSYISLDFLGSKIATDETRLNFSFPDYPDLLYELFGFGYDPESFHRSGLSSASSIFNLLRYVGVMGFFIFMMRMFKNNAPKRFHYFLVVSCILMNEPFLSNATIWWGMAFVCYDFYDELGPQQLYEVCDYE